MLIMSKAYSAAKKSNPVVLAVGDVFDWHESTRSIPMGAAVTFAEIAEITQDFLQEINPDIVLSCLVSQDFDFLDLAQALQAAKFKRCLRIIVPELPDPDIVLSEARNLCPNVNIDFEIDQTGRHYLIN